MKARVVPRRSWRNLTSEPRGELGRRSDPEALESRGLRDDGVRVAEPERREPFEPELRRESTLDESVDDVRIGGDIAGSGPAKDRVEPRARVLGIDVDLSFTERLEADLRSAESRR